MASSSTFGARPCFSQMSSYSAAVRPSATASSALGVACARVLESITAAGAIDEPAPCSRNSRLQRLAHRAEDAQAVARAAGELVDRVLGVGHQAEYVARGVAHAGDVTQRAVEVLARGVAQNDLAAVFELVDRPLVGVEAPH